MIDNEWTRRIRELEGINKELLRACKAALAHLDEDSSEASRWLGARLEMAINRSEATK